MYSTTLVKLLWTLQLLVLYGGTNVKASSSPIILRADFFPGPPRSNLAAVAVGDEVLIGGGRTDESSGSYVSSKVANIWSARTGTWRTGAPLSQPRSNLAASSAVPFALFAGGQAAVHATPSASVDIYHKALSDKKYECFLSSETKMPMMYMDDAIAATINIMKAPVEQIKIRSSYNLAAMSFTPTEIAAEIKKHIPELEVTYAPDFRQKIADSWPASIDDSRAREDWGWKHEFDLEMMTVDMIKNLSPQYSTDL